MLDPRAIIELDLHGKNAYQARVALDAALRRRGGAYRIRVIHGENRGTALRDTVREEYAAAPGVLRLEYGPGYTDLVLREL